MYKISVVYLPAVIKYDAYLRDKLVQKLKHAEHICNVRAHLSWYLYMMWSSYSWGFSWSIYVNKN